jgi:ABC-type uncharacterized transport system YnjBCD permease subunit
MKLKEVFTFAILCLSAILKNDTVQLEQMVVDSLGNSNYEAILKTNCKKVRKT